MRSSIETILSPIFVNLGMNDKRMNDFICKLFEAILVRRGRFNFTNLARFGDFHECTLRRRFGRELNWLNLNQGLIAACPGHADRPWIAAMDCSFIRKSGHRTAGLDTFWSGSDKKAQKGLEASVLSLIDVVGKKAWALDVSQTPAGLSSKSTGDKYSRIDFYAEQLEDCLPEVPQYVQYVAADSLYANYKIIQAVKKHGKHLITQLRSDANLRYLEALPVAGKRGPEPKWGEKVYFTQLDRWQHLGRDFRYKHLDLYTQVLYSPHFNCLLKVVLVKNTRSGEYRLIASTDIHQDARQIVAFYQSRFQIEFLIRDAKQFTGLEQAQCRNMDSLDFHFNASFTTVNLMQVMLKEIKPSLLSKNSLIRWAYNKKIIDRVIHKLDPKTEFASFGTLDKNLYHYGLLHEEVS
jgi:hypothetical protein